MSFFRLVALRHFLVWQFARREISQRYRGSVLGFAWALFTPLAMLAAYTLVFGFLFQGRSGFGEMGRLDFALFLYTGLVVHGLAADCLARSPSVVLAQPNLVKKVVFPLELLPFSSLLANFVQSLLNLLVLLMIYVSNAGMSGHLSWHVLLAPLVLATPLPLALGVGWLLSALGVFVRDIQHVMTMLISLLLFLSPVFYPVELVPEAWRVVFYLNPLTVVIESLRALLFAKTIPDVTGLALLVGGGLISSWVGLQIFQKLRPGFSDVL